MWVRLPPLLLMTNEEKLKQFIESWYILMIDYDGYYDKETGNIDKKGIINLIDEFVNGAKNILKETNNEEKDYETMG